jgi:hypothetical protein
MTLRHQIDDAKLRTTPGHGMTSLVSGIGTPGRACHLPTAPDPVFTPAPITTEQRPCDDCRTPAVYEPLRLRDDGPDLLARMRFLCDPCSEAMIAREEEEARKAVAARRQATWEKVIPEKYRSTDLRHPGFNAQVWNRLKTLDPARQPVGLIGPAGRCKSRMLALFAKRLIASDTFVAWTSSNRFQWAAQREFDDREGTEARQLLRRWSEARVLILDDLGKQRWTDTVEAAFFSLIEARSGANLVTHWSMNPSPLDAIGPAQLETYGPDIVARGLDSTGQASARARFAPILSRLLDGTLLIPVP